MSGEALPCGVVSITDVNKNETLHHETDRRDTTQYSSANNSVRPDGSSAQNFVQSQPSGYVQDNEECKRFSQSVGALEGLNFNLNDNEISESDPVKVMNGTHPFRVGHVAVESFKSLQNIGDSFIFDNTTSADILSHKGSSLPSFVSEESDFKSLFSENKSNEDNLNSVRCSNNSTKPPMRKHKSVDCPSYTDSTLDYSKSRKSSLEHRFIVGNVIDNFKCEEKDKLQQKPRQCQDKVDFYNCGPKAVKPFKYGQNIVDSLNCGHNLVESLYLGHKADEPVHFLKENTSGPVYGHKQSLSLDYNYINIRANEYSNISADIPPYQHHHHQHRHCDGDNCDNTIDNLTCDDHITRNTNVVIVHKEPLSKRENHSCDVSSKYSSSGDCLSRHSSCTKRGISDSDDTWHDALSHISSSVSPRRQHSCGAISRVHYPNNQSDGKNLDLPDLKVRARFASSETLEPPCTKTCSCAICNADVIKDGNDFTTVDILKNLPLGTNDQQQTKILSQNKGGCSRHRHHSDHTLLVNLDTGEVVMHLSHNVKISSSGSLLKEPSAIHVDHHKFKGGKQNNPSNSGNSENKSKQKKSFVSL